MGPFFFMASCKKKTANQKNIVAIWNIVEFQAPDMNSTAMAAIQQSSNTSEFTKKGAIIMTVGGEKMEGTYTTDENVSSITATISGNTSNYAISNYSVSGMTISSDKDMMKLSK